MKRFVFAALLIGGALALHAQDTSAQAVSIMTAVKNRVKVETTSTRSRIVITAKNGTTSEMVIDQYGKDDARGNSRIVIVFQRPANVAGTRFLTIDNASGGTDRWIFLNTLGRIRRIAASESGGSFMGTDFSYDDMSVSTREVNLDTHTILREETLNGSACYVIQSIPKDSADAYSKRLTWVDKEKNIIYKIEMYDRRGTLLKIMEISNYRDVQGRLTQMQTKMSTPAAGTSTTIFMDAVKYDDPIPESVFTTRFLETGRP